MITIPAGELCGLLLDVIPFGVDHPDSQHCAVRLEWDGELLHAMTMDSVRVGWSQWCPEDLPPVDVQDPIGTVWGGSRVPWAITIALHDAAEIAKIFRLPAKEAYGSPLSVDVDQAPTDGPDGAPATKTLLRVRRDADTGRSALTGVWEGVEIPLTLAAARELFARWDKVAKIPSIAFNPSLLADFAQVRTRGGAMRMTFTGRERPTLIEIGRRFQGLIQPIKEKEER